MLWSYWRWREESVKNVLDITIYPVEQLLICVFQQQLKWRQVWWTESTSLASAKKCINSLSDVQSAESEERIWWKGSVILLQENVRRNCLTAVQTKLLIAINASRFGRWMSRCSVYLTAKVFRRVRPPHWTIARIANGPTQTANSLPAAHSKI